MTNKVLTLVFSVALTGFTYGQFSGQIQTNMAGGGADQAGTAGAIATLLGPVSDSSQKRTLEWESFAGSPYTADVYQPAELFYKDEKVGPVFYRYNALNEEIEIKETPTQEGLRGLSRDKNIILKVDGNPMRFMTFIDKDGKTLNGYLTQLVDGENFDLYKRTRVKFTEGSKAANSFVQATPSRFTQFEEYYIQKAGVDRIDELVPKKGKLYNQISQDQRASLKAFIKDNDLDLDSDKDLMSIILFMDRNSEPES
ncbi:hypothetical protein [Robiginitalea aurantiaca]|uniref:Uncharacterized protein n=1 Tax=Robiginitalea aurantiaca TaxID=3056915 RepID=A0ABT7WDV3_9FLAO|nr:hypothetical protein [Robiginitalea aurantiaca]MDM9631091.1 hypothetical protein [Robiginitalea aurantiaca]